MLKLLQRMDRLLVFFYEVRKKFLKLLLVLWLEFAAKELDTSVKFL